MSPLVLAQATYRLLRQERANEGRGRQLVSGCNVDFDNPMGYSDGNSQGQNGDFYKTGSGGHGSRNITSAHHTL